MNIFTQIHTDRDGNSQPIVSMQADHLCNLVNFILVKSIERLMQREKVSILGEYAPEDMPEATRRFLGLRKLTGRAKTETQAELDEILSDAMETAMEKAMPYIVVGVCRDDTRAGIVAILQKATGITGRVELPALMGKIESVDDEFLLESGRDLFEGLHGFGDDD